MCACLCLCACVCAKKEKQMTILGVVDLVNSIFPQTVTYMKGEGIIFHQVEVHKPTIGGFFPFDHLL